MLMYLNGSWVEESQAIIPFREMGFLYGDSLFETIRVVRAVPFRLERHLERLREGMAVIRLQADDALATVNERIDEFILRNEFQEGLLRLIITRGTLSGLPWSQELEPNLYLTGRPLSPLPAVPARVVFYQEKDYPILRFRPAIKSGNYLGNLLAKKDAEQANAFEPVFVNPDGYITECAIRNIFFIRDDVLLTPATDLGILPGVIRNTVLELAEGLGLGISETHIRHSEINTMDEAFITSTGVGVLPVTWDGFHSDYVITTDLEQALTTLWNQE